MLSYKKLLPPSLFELQELRGAGPLRLFCEALSTGLAAGLVMGLFRHAYTLVNTFLADFFVATPHSPLKVVLAALFVGLCMALALWTMHRQPLVSGSGIPHVELCLAGRLPMPWASVLVCKFLGTLASICGCLSLGRGAPSVQMGAAVGCGIGRLWHDDGLRPRFLVAGSVAGLAAAFGTPWAGVFFAFEELRTLLRLPLLCFMALAALAAWFMTDVVLGLGLVFPLPLETPFLRAGAAGNGLAMLCLSVAVCGPGCGLVCALYNRATAGCILWADRHLSRLLRLALAFGLGLVLLFVYPAVIDGLGPGLPDHAADLLPLGPLMALCAAKIVFNWLSAASNAPGGLLMPLLVAGGLTGAVCAALFRHAGLDVPAALPMCLCMAGFFAGIVRAPLTAAFLVAEATGNWAALPALLAVAFLAALTANALHSRPIFTFMRQRQLRSLRQEGRKAGTGHGHGGRQTDTHTATN